MLTCLCMDERGARAIARAVLIVVSEVRGLAVAKRRVLQLRGHGGGHLLRRVESHGSRVHRSQESS